MGTGWRSGNFGHRVADPEKAKAMAVHYLLH